MSNISLKEAWGWKPPQFNYGIMVLYVNDKEYMSFYVHESAGITGGGKGDLIPNVVKIPVGRTPSGSDFIYGEIVLPNNTPWTIDYFPNYEQNNAKYKDIAYVPSIKLTSETTAVLPSNRARTEIGVGEEVTVNADQKVSWKFSNENLVLISYQDQEKIVFSALDKEGSFTAIAYTEDTENRISFGIKTPSNASYILKHKIGEKAILMAGAIAEISILPSSVNFSNIVFREKDSRAQTSGPLFKDGEGIFHGGKDYINGYSKSLPATHDGKINKAFEDLISARQDEFGVVPFVKSSIMWPITLEWSLNNKDYYPFYNTTQKTVVDENGYVTTSKGDLSVTRHFLDADMNLDKLEEFRKR